MMNDDMSMHEFRDYLTKTLIPDLIESGMTATAEDFETAVGWMNMMEKEILTLRKVLSTKQ